MLKVGQGCRSGYQDECPTCDCPYDELGCHSCQHDLRDLDAVLNSLEYIGEPQSPRLPVTSTQISIRSGKDYFLSAPTLDHHPISWLKQSCGEFEIDKRVQRLPVNHSIRNSKKCINSSCLFSGMEHHRQISRALLIDIRLTGGVSSASLIRATRAILD